MPNKVDRSDVTALEALATKLRSYDTFQVKTNDKLLNIGMNSLSDAHVLFLLFQVCR